MRPTGVPVAALLAAACLVLQASGAEDLYWEGEEDASNEFLEVKHENTGLGGHFNRIKRGLLDFWFTTEASATTSTTAAPELLDSTDDPDSEIGPDEDHGSGSPDQGEDAGEKTLRVNFVVMEPYLAAYSNRDSPEFQNFSRTIGDAVDLLYKNMPGEQKASLVRIQSRVSDNFSCKVTLDIVTTNYDNLDAIGNMLRDHIMTRRQLGEGSNSVKVSDADFSFMDINPSAPDCAESEIRCNDNSCVPGSVLCDGHNDCPDGADEQGCEIDNNNNFNQEVDATTARTTCQRIACQDSAAAICVEQRCDGIPDCPNGDDEIGCEEEEEEVTTPTPEVATTPFQPPIETGNCHDDEFACDETRCIPTSARCDRNQDCYDGTDEAGCPVDETCGADDFRCPSNNNCIVRSRVCDKISDCPNEEDERDCVCDATEFRCVDDGSCIEGRKRCDGKSNCRDSSDEQNCHFQKMDWWGNYVCQDSGRFRCRDGTCISILLRCDGFRDCAKDGSDEIGCPCGTDQWQCDFGNCIKRTQRCDGRVDCPTDRSDERNCVDIGKFRCRSGKLIPETLRCNRRYDCPDEDYSDEQYCPCGDGDFKCDNGYCIPASKHCDRTHDCQDGTDERDCHYGTVCMAFQYKCTSGQCVPAESKCNGTTECSDSSDELNCPCKRGQFTCRDGSCISLALRCNGIKECRAGEDEYNCASTEECGPGEMVCNPGSSVRCGVACDYQPDCDGGEDEENCDCSHRCDGNCLSDQQICNGVPDCSDGSDEHNCDHCDETMDFRCKSGECINIDQYCNGIEECNDRSDELDCNKTMITKPDGCAADMFTCDDGTCINLDFMCDDRPDCFDGSDEKNCPWYITRPSRSPGLPACLDSEFTCYDGRCITHLRRCDNIYDCMDFSDEQNCYNSDCDDNQFRCDSGACVPLSAFCDQIPDCEDQSDEARCPTVQPPGTTTMSNIYPPITPEATTAGYPYGEYDRNRPDGGYNYPGQGGSDDRNRPDDDYNRVDQPGDVDRNRPDSGFNYPGQGGDYDRNRPDNRPGFRPNVGSGYPGQGGDYDRNRPENRPGYRPEVGSNYPGQGDGYDRNRPENRPGYRPDSGSNYPGQGGDSDRNRPENRPGYRPDSGSNYPGQGGDYDRNRPENRPGYRPDSGSNYPGQGGDNDRNRPENRPGYRPDDVYNRPGQNGDDDRYVSGNGYNYPDQGSRPDDSFNRVDQDGSEGTERPAAGSDYPGQGGYRPNQPGDYDSNGLDNGFNRPATGGCNRNEWRCENGPCIQLRQRCDGHLDCPFDSSDEFDCPAGSPIALNLKTYPPQQTIRNGGDVVFQCRDEGPLRAAVRWVRDGGRPLKPGSMDRNGRLEMERVTMADSGVYICQAVRYLGHPSAELRVTLHVDPTLVTSGPVAEQCRPDEATCANGQCIPKSALCDNNFDCSDRSDEEACHVNGKCEPNQFKCDNNKCVLKTWMCDSEDDCGDNSDERNCGTSAPGQCQPVEFTCASGDQCVPKSFHCDGQSDCIDRSDEIGCAQVYVTSPPRPSHLQLNTGETMTLNCTATGTPTPLISWRRNWGDVPEVCSTENIQTNSQVLSILTCPDMQPEYNGAYSCEAMNNKGTLFAVPDAIVFVNKTDVCPRGTFNRDARTERECIRCFCFGESTSCHSADLFTYNMPTPLGEGGTRLVGVKNAGNGEFQVDPTGVMQQYYYQPMRNGALITRLANPSSSSSAVPYLTLPETYNGNQLTSYGGHIKYRITAFLPDYGSDYGLPHIIIKGKYQDLMHFNRRGSSVIDARLTPENWEKSSRGSLVPATREDIMMALDNIEMILLRGSVRDAGVNITEFVMESAHHINTGLGAVNLVEECSCPPGYGGLSCEKCASGYSRVQAGRWLGNCEPERPTCPPGTYGDPNSGYACRPCPCPLTNRENQFARTCALGPDGRVACDCRPGYEGNNCEYCSEGYMGNPLVLGDSCKPKPQTNCNPTGTSYERPPDECECKDNVLGRYCDQCKNGSFFLSNDFRQGCALCFCSGVSQQCSSSNLRRRTTTVRFNTPDLVRQVKVYSSSPVGVAQAVRYNSPVETDLTATYGREELVLTNYDRNRPLIYYWSLPVTFAGDKVTSYGGYLRYTLHNVPLPGYTAKNNAADVQLISENHLTFHYFGDFTPSQDGTLEATVPFLEKGWQRPDGKEVSREHFLLALADVKAILVKATYTSNGNMASLVGASIDTAERDGNGQTALHVEQCVCPVGYVGTSCEDCALGYTRIGSGLYLEHCGLCECNGHSTMCNGETGVCENCQDNTDGDFCEQCKPGYRRDAYNRCVPEDNRPNCNCDPRGSSGPCDSRGYCECKQNVEGRNCDSCRPGTFGLDASNPAGCHECYCSGATSVCQDASSQYIRVPLPAPVFAETFGGYTLMDINAENVISDQFVAVPNESELMYSFPFPPNEELYWSLPVFPGNRIVSYGGFLQLKQRFESNSHRVSEPGTDVVLVGDDLSLYWSNPNPISDGQALSYKVPLTEKGWFLLNFGTPARRSDLLSVLKNLRRVLVRATLVQDIYTTSIADVSMDTASDLRDSGYPPATGVELCKCPEGYEGTSCERCSPGFYQSRYGCQRCNCNGHDCHVTADDQVVCSCRQPYTGNDCSILGDSNKQENATIRPQPPSPTVTVQITSSQIQIKATGSSVNFTCKAQSQMSNNLTVRWSKVDGMLPQGRTQVDDALGMIIIRNLQTTDSGKYICQTFDGFSAAQATATLQVNRNEMTYPTAEIIPPINDYYEGDRIELRCLASGNPTPRISWQRMGRAPPIDSQFYNDLFIIENAHQEDSGEYRCRVENTVGAQDRTAVVNIRHRPSQPQREKLSVSQEAPVISEGSDTQVVCTGTADVPEGSIGWARHDGDVQSNVQSNNGVLYIKYARIENQGVYVCQTTTGRLRPVLITVTVVPIGTPKPQIAPNVTVSLEELKIPTGGTGRVDCNPIGYPPPIIRWEKYDSKGFGEGTSQQGNTLVIVNAKESDAGFYLCKGLVDGERNGYAYTRVVIEKREKPSVEIWPDGEQAVTLGSPFELRCLVRGGVPEPAVTWSRAGGRSLPPYAEILPDNIVKFDRVEVNDEGEYSCVASNEAGTASASTIIKVHSPPVVTILPSTSVHAYYGDAVRVQCRAEGYPQPYVSIKTYPDMREIVSPLPGVAILSLPYVTNKEEGNYICSASSPAGTIEDQFNIAVSREVEEGSGEDNIDPDSQNQLGNQRPSELLALEGERTRIVCSESSDTSRATWSRADRRPLQPNAQEQNGVLIITRTSKQDSGEYICTVENRYGDVTNSVTTYLRVISPPRVTLRPPSQTVRPGESPTVQCVVEGDDIEDIVWRPVTKPFSSRVGVLGSTLIFNRIEVEDAGKYECYAKNQVADGKATAEVIVSEETDRAPSESHDNEQRAHVGASVHLSCNVQTSPAGYQITWTKNGRSLPSTIKQRTDGSLYIRLAKKSHSGQYVCNIQDIYGRRTSNYINLHIEGEEDCDSSTHFRCFDLSACVHADYLCDGYSDCPDNSDEESCILREKRVRPTMDTVDIGGDETPALVFIDKSRTSKYRVGDNVAVTCRGLSRDVRVSWERYNTRQYVESRTYGDGAVLTVNNVQPSDAGLYRCTGRDPYDRTSYEDFELEVIPGNPAWPPYPSEELQQYTARQGESMDIACNANLEQPNSVEWRREYSNEVRDTTPILHLEGITEKDAGTYVCRLSNGRTVVEGRSLLRVVGILPRFNGDSWISLPTLKDAYNQFDVEISFKPIDRNGVILFNSQMEDGNGDYLALHLQDGVPHLTMDAGAGAITVTGDRPLQLNTWHTIRITKVKFLVIMTVDNMAPKSKRLETEDIKLLELAAPLYIGGVPSFIRLPSPLPQTSSPGFVGCVSMLILGPNEKNIMLDHTETYNVQECESCSPNYCKNDGVCQEALNEAGYMCLCPAGFAGRDCDRTGEACRPGLCGEGKCSDTADGYKCSCPVTYTGKNCDVKQSIEYPAFTGSAYLAIKAPKESRHFRLWMKVKAASPVTDGIIMYAAESARGFGGFTALTVHRGRLEFIYDLGDGSTPVVLTSNRTLPANEWTDVRTMRTGFKITLTINLLYTLEGMLNSTKSEMNFETPMFVGGIDETIQVNNATGVSGGFHGCIKDVESFGNAVDIVGQSILSANVQECSNYDRGDIPEVESICPLCRNGGQCSEDGSTCECLDGFTGTYCEVRVPPLARRRPTGDPCAAQPCRNGGSCRRDYANQMNYTCDCPLGFAGATCQMKLELRHSVAFNGNGYLELPASQLRYEDLYREPAVIAMAFYTNTDGVLLYQREVQARPDTGDFILIRIEHGVVVLEWNLGGGLSSVSVEEVHVADLARHSIIVTLNADGSVTLTVDGTTKNGSSGGFYGMKMNADSNIYIGGIPENVNPRQLPGFSGCVEQIELMSADRAMNIGQEAVAGRNTQRCRNSELP